MLSARGAVERLIAVGLGWQENADRDSSLESGRDSREIEDKEASWRPLAVPHATCINLCLKCPCLKFPSRLDWMAHDILSVLGGPIRALPSTVSILRCAWLIQRIRISVMLGRAARWRSAGER